MIKNIQSAVSKLLSSICNPDVYDKFFREQAVQLRNFLFFKYGSEKDAEDVVQESFIRLWNNCEKVPLEKAKGFLYTAANNLSLSMKRHEKVKLNHKMEVKVEDRDHQDPEFSLLEKEFQDKLKNAMEQLPDRQREAFLLSRIEKKTYQEISEIMGVSVKAIEKLMHKALIKIRRQIGNI